MKPMLALAKANANYCPVSPTLFHNNTANKTSSSLTNPHMKTLLCILLFLCTRSTAQTPVPMTMQPMLTYIEAFDSISTWTNNFGSGKGANRFTAVPTGGTATIPDPMNITTNSSSFITTQMSAGGLYKDTTGKLLFLVTGTTNNTNSLAIDMHFDFTGINAGNLSFDWATVFNGVPTSNRTGTLKIYASVNGTAFTELTAAEVTATNHTFAGGSITNVTLPASFNNSSPAFLRFYYYNSAGGTTGSRPALAIDNIKITASGNPCTTPVAPATNLSFNNVTATSVSGSFTAANPAPDGYMIVATSQGSLTSLPADSTVYQPGDDVGDGTVIYIGNGNSFTATDLNPSTAYTFYVFSVNQYCNGSLRYLSTNPLTDMQSTTAGPPCQAPVQAPSNLIFSNLTTTGMNGDFTASPDASEYLVVASVNNTLSANPVNGMDYNPGDLLGGGWVLYRGGATHFTSVNLSHSTTYYYFIFGLNDFACSGGPVYLTSSILMGQQSTHVLLPCNTPDHAAKDLILQPDQNAITGFFTPGDAVTDAYLVVMSSSNSLSALPQDGIHYTLGNSLGGGTVISMGKNYSFYADGLSGTTLYYFFIFPYNDICIGGPIYKTDTYLQGNATTIVAPALNYYFGNLHSHSSHSDGNQDDKAKIPYDDYDFAKNALCMDFLGISEHNHYTSKNNPGMTLANYSLGLNDATNYTNAHPGFLALYGMEWGTLSNGGHSLIYGIDSLLGWETINGRPNYDIFVPKNDYVSPAGLFNKVNSFASSNAFSTLAHPSFNDYQQLAYSPYNASADSAIAGIALESGPAFSTDTSYTAPGSNMEFLDYYLRMLSLGYHIAPVIDHDNHNMTFGRTANSRTAVIASSIAKNDFMQAMRNMHFYATQGCNTQANISIQGQMMGSEITHEYAPAIVVTTKNASSSVLPVVKIMYGIPGSGLAPTELISDTARALSYTDITLPQNSTAYYYADISYGTKRTITAPIWYTRLPDPVLEHVPGKTSNSMNEIKLLANPVSQYLELYIKTKQQKQVTFTIYNLSGQKVISYPCLVTGSQTIHLPVSSLPAGMYILESFSDNEKTRLKFVKS